MADLSNLANGFVKSYYDTFHGSRKDLARFYHKDSILTFEGSQITGTEDIMKKRTSPEMQHFKHTASSIDAQPLTTGGILIMVTGILVINQDFGSPQVYCQVFHLHPEGDTGSGAFYLANDIYRLANAS